MVEVRYDIRTFAADDVLNGTNSVCKKLADVTFFYKVSQHRVIELSTKCAGSDKVAVYILKSSDHLRVKGRKGIVDSLADCQTLHLDLSLRDSPRLAVLVKEVLSAIHTATLKESLAGVRSHSPDINAVTATLVLASGGTNQILHRIVDGRTSLSEGTLSLVGSERLVERLSEVTECRVLLSDVRLPEIQEAILDSIHHTTNSWEFASVE